MGDAMTDRISDDTLHRLLRAAHIYDAWQADLTSAIRELQERRKGEYICPKCQLRQDDAHEKGDF
jgi:hypothetical protein